MIDCNKCDKTCEPPCGCAEPVFSIEPMSDDPSVLRFNINGKSVWYDFSPVVKAAETCTTIGLDTVNRGITHDGECGVQSITSKELGSVLHLGDLGDVNASTITDNGILNYRKNSDCPEGCEGTGDGWVSSNAIDVSGASVEYILGADADGKFISLRAPDDRTKFYYLSFAAEDSAKWVTPSVAASAPLDSDGKVWRLYVDPSTNEILVVKENP